MYSFRFQSCDVTVWIRKEKYSERQKVWKKNKRHTLTYRFFVSILQRKQTWIFCTSVWGLFRAKVIDTYYVSTILWRVGRGCSVLECFIWEEGQPVDIESFWTEGYAGNFSFFPKWHFWTRAWNLKFFWPKAFFWSIMKLAIRKKYP